MKSERRFNRIGMKALLVAGLFTLASLPLQAVAQDADRDGYVDREEANLSLIPYGMSTEFQVHPSVPDAFVILKPSSSSLFPTDWKEPLERAQSVGGLGLHVNLVMDGADPDRTISCQEYNSDETCATARQKGGRITEDTFNAVGSTLGWCQQGTFNDEDNCIIYTARVVNHIKSVCGTRYGTSNCRDQYRLYGDDLVKRFVTWVMVHELGHSMTIERCYVEANGGNHTPAGTGYIMDQSVVAVDKQGVVTFTIPDVYSTESQSAVDLAFEKDSAVCETITSGKKK